MNNETIEANLSSEKGKEAVDKIKARIDVLLKEKTVKNKLTEMHELGKSKEQCRQWLTLLAISTLFGLPKAGGETQYNYLAGKLIELLWSLAETP